ncbi:MAG: enolase N-terminal-like fold-containing protein, partial [bacterium]
MIIDEVLDSIKDEAGEHRVKDIIVGLRQVLVVLDDNRAGLSMTLRGNYTKLPDS